MRESVNVLCRMNAIILLYIYKQFHIDNVLAIKLLHGSFY